MTEQPTAPFPFYPVSLDVSGRPCLVVGGGPVAARKARGLLECGARVTVIAPSLSPDMQALGSVLHTVEQRRYRPGDAARFRLVVTATGLPDIDAEVYADAERAGVWVNGADDRVHSSFILPAVHRDSAVSVAVSTGGLSPALSSWLRDRLAAECVGIGTLAQLLGQARERILRIGLSSNSVDWASLLHGPLPELVRAGDVDDARAIVDDAVANVISATRP
jgi:siroheme synthase-like protein